MTEPTDLPTVVQALPEQNAMHTGIVEQTFPLVIGWKGGQVIEPGVLDWYVPIVGDNVALMRQGQTWLCMGRIRSGAISPVTGVLGTAGTSTTGTSGNTTSATYVDLPGQPALLFRKAYDETALLFHLSVTYFSTGGDAGGAFGARANGLPNITLTQLGIANGTNGVRQATSGSSVMGGLSSGGAGAGVHTFVGLWARIAGVGTLQWSADDWWSLSVQEYWP